MRMRMREQHYIAQDFEIILDLVNRETRAAMKITGYTASVAFALATPSTTSASCHADSCTKFYTAFKGCSTWANEAWERTDEVYQVIYANMSSPSGMLHEIRF